MDVVASVTRQLKGLREREVANALGRRGGP